ncbi:MAG: XdhC family protein [Opitutales bacterium]|jgi:xanthine dehydrogenase accessory factor|nr:XdhC family protein [bacterium]MDG2168398.1 XdhC family protein [Opitutales bacterium]
MLEFWNKVVYELDCYSKVFVAIVVEHKKGTPGTSRAMMLRTEAGEVLGTIGGGVMESRLLDEAEGAIERSTPEPQLKTLVHRQSKDHVESGLICGGSQTVVTLVLNPDHRRVLYEVCSCLRQGNAGRLIISPAGISLESESIEDPSCSLQAVEQNWEAAIGLLNRRRVLIVGCGHCGAALARQMDLLGFHVTVVESRIGLPSTENLPKRVQVLNKPYSEAAKDLEFAILTFAVVMTPSYLDDVDALASLLPEALPFIGVMGSPSKLQKIKEKLYARGFNDSDWDRVTAPVGLPVNSDTPAEIGVSVAAQILQLTNLASDT